MEFQELQETIYKILNSALSSVDPYNLIKEQLTREKNLLIFPDGKKMDLNMYNRILLLGAGKGVAPMTRAMEELLGKNNLIFNNN